MDLPTNINIRSPLAIKRCHELVERGDARNYGEAADHLILIGYAQEQRDRGSDGDTSNNQQPTAATAGAV